MACNINLPLGKGDSSSNLGDLKKLGISNVDFSYATYEATQSIESIRAYIEEDATYVITPNITGADVTASEAVTETDAYSQDRDTRNTPGSMILYFDSNPCQWKAFVKSLNRNKYYIDLYLIGEGKNWKYLQNTDTGTYKPFKVQLNALSPGLGFDNKIQQYRLRVNFDNVDQFDNASIVELIDPLIDYEDAMPVGWDYNLVGAYAATNQDIKVWERCCRSSLMTQTPTARIIDQNVDTPAVSAGAPVDGVSTLTITKESSPVTLVAGEYIDFVLESKTVDVVDYTSNVIRVKG